MWNPPSGLDQTGVFHKPRQKERTVDRVIAPYNALRGVEDLVERFVVGHDEEDNPAARRELA
jgi:hypothetical protein